ncbi:MAG: methylmalonyl-CoA mutase, partial [Acidobacteriales bacterium]|nr:methylmalonyl-CoA mutase [Terriglobales bacterium]
AHMTLVPRVREAMNEADLSDVPIIVGGIIPDEDKAALAQMGVVGVFGPGTSTETIRDFINNLVMAKDVDA